MSSYPLDWPRSDLSHGKLAGCLPVHCNPSLALSDTTVSNIPCTEMKFMVPSVLRAGLLVPHRDVQIVGRWQTTRCHGKASAICPSYSLLTSANRNCMLAPFNANCFSVFVYAGCFSAFTSFDASCFSASNSASLIENFATFSSQAVTSKRRMASQRPLAVQADTTLSLQRMRLRAKSALANTCLTNRLTVWPEPRNSVLIMCATPIEG